MQPRESPEAAAARAVREELGARAHVRILGGDGARVEERESASYPGLPARYVLHAVDAEVVDGVPEDGEFETEETGEDDGDAGAITVKRHYWDWIDDDGDSERKEVGLLCSVTENCWTNCAAVESEMSRGNESREGDSAREGEGAAGKLRTRARWPRVYLRASD